MQDNSSTSRPRLSSRIAKRQSLPKTQFANATGTMMPAESKVKLLNENTPQKTRSAKQPPLKTAPWAQTLDKLIAEQGFDVTEPDVLDEMFNNTRSKNGLFQSTLEFKAQLGATQKEN